MLFQVKYLEQKPIAHTYFKQLGAMLLLWPLLQAKNLLSSRATKADEIQEGDVLHKGGIMKVQRQSWVELPSPVGSHGLSNKTR